MSVWAITITSPSIIVTVFIGGLEVLQVTSRQLNLTDGDPWDYANGFDPNKAGFVIVGLFVLSWTIALSVWRLAHIEEKRSAGIRGSESSRNGPRPRRNSRAEPGGRKGTRTPDILLVREALYQLSYAPVLTEGRARHRLI
jgi:hypothetical protein